MLGTESNNYPPQDGQMPEEGSQRGRTEHDVSGAV